MEDRQRGAELAATFQLNQFRGVIGDAALRTLADAASVTALTTALAKMNPQTDSKLHALAETTSIIGQTTEQRREVIQNLLANNAEAIPQLISKAMLAASSVEQRRVAETLASDSSGAALLVELAEAGRASAWLLKHPQIEPKLRAAANEELKKRIDILTSRLPDESEDLIKLISNRRKNHVSVAGDVALGAALFTKTCATCHQIGGKGKKVGPNLDGIGTRGLDRLIEDILAPNRNVDVAFRSSTIVTNQGKVLNGLVKQTEGARLILVDSKGEEISVATDTIDQQVLSNLSPMPANFGDSLTEDQFRQLVTYLLSLRSS